MASAPDAFSSTSLGSQGKQDEELGDFFEKLDLHEEEFDDVIVEEEAPDLVEEIPWLALARVQTFKNFSQAAFFKDMRAAWNTAKPVRYEKLARFCKACGIIGHDHKECGNGVYAESDLKFGDYLYADPPGKVQ
ncbi:hypothetical protein D1007_52084 [Hordeum vulgare]|nr:hypothetical protein D1007_52084 [Hordeum vulgare]